MKIAIDLQAVQGESRFRGIGRYSKSIALAIARTAADRHEIFIFLSDRFPGTVPEIRSAFKGLIPENNIKVFSVPGPVAEMNGLNAWRTRAAELIREQAIALVKPDALVIASLFEGWGDDIVTSVPKPGGDFYVPTAVILYDVIPLIHKDAYLCDPYYKKWYYGKIEHLKKANLLMAISGYSMDEAVKELELDKNSVVNISAAVDEKFFYCADDTSGGAQKSEESRDYILSRFNIGRKYIMYAPGGFDSRKNVETLIDAYALLPKKIRAEYSMVIASSIPEDIKRKLIKKIRANKIGIKNVIFTGYVQDDELTALYKNTELFVFPSLYEGFGLPILEAMNCGAPVIASDTSSIPEILDRKDALFDPSNALSVSEAMSKALSDKKFLSDMKRYGKERSKDFSWDITAKKAVDALELTFNKKTVSGHKENDAEDYCKSSYHKLIGSIASINAIVPISKHASRKMPRHELNLNLLNAAICINKNNANYCRRKQKEFFADVSELARRDAKTGIQRVVRNILINLLKNPPEGYAVKAVYFDGKSFRYANNFMRKFHTAGDGAKENETKNENVIEPLSGDIFLCLDLAPDLMPAAKNILYEYNIHGIEIYSIIYDILPVTNPEWWPKNIFGIMKEWLTATVEVSNSLICISNSTANEVKKWIKLNFPEKVNSLTVSYFHIGADIVSSASVNASTGEGRTYVNQGGKNKETQTQAEAEQENVCSILCAGNSAVFLSVGTIEPRKGHLQTLKAFEYLWKRGLDAKLVFVGKEGWMTEEVVRKIKKHKELGVRLFWLKGISDEYLDKIYKASSCLIAASEGEGFGLPLIEAARYNLPVIARNIPVFKEIAGESVYYFDGLRPVDLAGAVINRLKLYGKGEEPKSGDIKWLTWEQSAEMLKGKIFNER